MSLILRKAGVLGAIFLMSHFMPPLTYTRNLAIDIRVTSDNHRGFKGIAVKTLFTALCLVALGSSVAFAGHVSGYYRSNGTYVAPSYRSNRDSTVTNNYSYQGNTNPYTGSSGTSYYRHDLTSPSFNGTPYGNGHYGHSGY